jgi:hypothetical protein
MKRYLAFGLPMLFSLPLSAGPQNASDAFQVSLEADVDAICSLIPEGIAPTVRGTLASGSTYEVSQNFQYGCNAPYELNVLAAFGKLKNISAAANGQDIGIEYTLRFDGQPVTLDYMKRATLTSVSSYQSLMPLQSHIGSVSVSTPGAEDIVAGRYEEQFIITLSSRL